MLFTLQRRVRLREGKQNMTRPGAHLHSRLCGNEMHVVPVPRHSGRPRRGSPVPDPAVRAWGAVWAAAGRSQADSAAAQGRG